MKRLGLWVGLWSCCVGLCFTAAPQVTRPDPNGFRVVTLAEGTPANTYVMKVEASGSRSIKIMGFQVTGFLYENPTGAYGDFQVTNNVFLTTRKALDYERFTSYKIKLTIEWTEPQNTDTAATVEFTVKVSPLYDEAPAFDSSTTFTANVREEQAIGTEVFPAFSITDDDEDDATYFTLTGVDAGYFYIDHDHGNIMTGVIMDRDGPNAITKFNLQVTVTDKGGNSDTRALVVTLTGINDNAPVCSSHVIKGSVPENTGPGVTVASVSCTDLDGDSNIDTSTYTIISGDDSGSLKFWIDTSGRLWTTTNSLDYEYRNDYRLVINVLDKGTPIHTGSATVHVQVTGINEVPPVWGGTIPDDVITVPENMDFGSVVFIITATDADAGKDGTVTYSLVSVIDNLAGQSYLPQDQFFVDEETGEVMIMTQLDFESGRTFFTIQVKAEDQGNPPWFTTMSLTLNIENLNDNAPVFTKMTFSTTIDETVALANSWMGVQLSAEDPDEPPENMEYRILSGNTRNKFFFSTDPGSLGRLKQLSPINVDLPDQDPFKYIMTVQVSSEGDRNIAIVIITINPMDNTHTPTFGTPLPNSAVAIDETVQIGYSVVTVSATDNDLYHGKPETITYSIIGGNTDDDFSIDINRGEVITAHSLSFLRLSTYDLLISATDSGPPNQQQRRTRNIRVQINVVDVNEEAPTCSSYNLNAFVNENNAEPYPLTTEEIGLNCGDSDGDTLQYSMDPAVAGFSIDLNTGDISVLTALDYEERIEHILDIKVSDGDYDTGVTVTVHVQPVNEHEPVFNPPTYTTAVPENTAARISVLRVTATDKDEGDDGAVRYSITGGNNRGSFVVNSATGEITITNVGLNREIDSEHTLEITASDSSSTLVKSTQATVIITVLDVNDNAPMCIPETYLRLVTEPSFVGATVATLTVTDDDEEQTPPTFQITAGNEDGVFEMQRQHLVLTETVDYESTKAYTLTITASDEGSTHSCSCRVDVHIVPANDNVPDFANDENINLLESLPIGSLVFSASAVDADADLGASVTYSIVSGNPGQVFLCDPATGNVFIRDQLDYDTPPQSYRLELEARDSGGLKDTMILMIQLVDTNDQTPVFERNIYLATVEENKAAGTTVVTVSATDTDTGDNGTVTYTAVDGTDLALILFAVDSTTGAITTTGTLDREAQSMYFLYVAASDGGSPPLTSKTRVDIEVTDVNDNRPVFTVPDLTVAVKENVSLGTAVATLAATDADSSAVITYFLVHDDFNVDPISGVLSTKQQLDRETIPSYELILLAKDSSVPEMTGTATVSIVVEDVNDNSPSFIDVDSLVVSEDAAIGIIVGTVNASDADKGENARLSYAIENSDHFSITDGGVIQVSGQLDRETKRQHNLQIEVQDHGTPPRSTTSVVTITVTDVNDKRPVWEADSYFFRVDDNTETGKSVGKVTAKDDDEGENAILTYSIVFWTGQNDFKIDSSTGVIRTAAMTDRESRPQYDFVVRVSDNGKPPLHSSVSVTISIISVGQDSATISENCAECTTAITDTVAADERGNVFVAKLKQMVDRERDQTISFTLLASDGLHQSADVVVTVSDEDNNGPIFTNTVYNTETDYSGRCSRHIVTVKANDADSGVNSEVIYYLQPSDDAAFSQVHTRSGTVFPKPNVITADAVYKLIVSARDGGVPFQTAATLAVIRVGSVVTNRVVITFELGITMEAFEAWQNTFLWQLQDVMQGTYPAAVARIWCTEMGSNRRRRRRRNTGPTDVHVYFLSDDSAESSTNIDAAKSYIAGKDALAVFTSDPAGTPGSVLSGSKWDPFDIRSIRLYDQPNKPRAPTTVGSEVIAGIFAGGFVLIVATVFISFIICHRKPAHRSRRPPYAGRLNEDGMIPMPAKFPVRRPERPARYLHKIPSFPRGASASRGRPQTTIYI